MPVKFGTDGWRGIISEDFTFTAVRRVAQAYVEYLLDQHPEGGEVVVGYDTRFLSAEYAWEAAQVLVANGLTVWLTSHSVPTPVVSYCVRRRGARGGLVITASHNPPQYNGIKLKNRYGGPLEAQETAKVEGFLQLSESGCDGESAASPSRRALSPGLLRSIDPLEDYYRAIESLINFAAIRNASLRVVIDPMYGAGRGLLKELLDRHGVETYEVHGEYNPSFAGRSPEPTAANLVDLGRLVTSLRAQVGLALAGDADCLGVTDNRGQYVRSNMIFGLLLRHLVESRGLRGTVVKTVSTSDLLDLLCRKYRLPVVETPVGFRHISPLLCQEGALMGGEESGGVGVARHLPERDGLLAACLLLEMLAGASQPLHEIIRRLTSDSGTFILQRLDIHLEPGQAGAVLELLRAMPPAAIEGCPVLALENLDGLKFRLADREWLLVRASGTEPLLRLYAESTSAVRTPNLLKAGRELCLALLPKT